MTCDPRPSIRRSPPTQPKPVGSLLPPGSYRAPLPEHGSRVKRNVDNACRACLAALRDGPKTVTEIVLLTEKAPGTIYSALTVLEEQGKVTRLGRVVGHRGRAKDLWMRVEMKRDTA
jgi:DNA-binding transcriptional ArsR family regulator